MNQTLKIFIPMAGWGTRMRPHTWSKPKPLVSVAGKTMLEHVIGMFETIPNPDQVEFVFIVGPYLGELQVPPFITENYPDMKAHFVVQNDMKGQSHALSVAHEFMNGPMIVCFSDTLIETDFSFLAQEQADVVAWVKPMPDPRRFGVAVLDKEGWVTRFIEKPESMDNNLVVVGCYYFKSAEKLLSAIEEQIDHGLTTKGEYFLTDSVTLMIEAGSKVRVQKADSWLDTGTIESTLETNIYMLDHKRDNSAEAAQRPGVTVVPPVFIHASATVESSVIGPHVSIAPGCKVYSCVIRRTILDEGAEVTDSVLDGSFIGRDAKVEGHPAQINMGDDSDIRL
ncbi:MAG: nucleotidyltransferase [Chloroflexi bacterium]|nr:MAG: nucleotidyltransferase [Chloroflexota bacterium]